MIHDTFNLIHAQGYSGCSSLRKWGVLGWELNSNCPLSRCSPASGWWVKILTQGHVYRTESDCFVTNSFLEYCLLPPNERCYRVYFNYRPHSLGLNYRYCFHLLLQNVMCSSRIWKRSLHPIPLYATMSLFCWRKFIWHSISDFWMLSMTMQEPGCAAVLGGIMTIIIITILYYDCILFSTQGISMKKNYVVMVNEDQELNLQTFEQVFPDQ